MEGNTNRPGTALASNDECRKLNPFQQYLGISLEELRMERRAQELTKLKAKRNR